MVCVICFCLEPARRFDIDDSHASSACGCIMTLQLTEQPEEREKRCWTVPADFRNRNDAKVAVLQLAFEQGAIEFLRFNGEPPPEGYKVELPSPREPKKAKRKGTDAAENESEAPPKKKTKLLSQAEQFLAATLPSNPTEARASGCSWPSQARPATSTAAILLPRPGYVDPRPEPGELPAEPPAPEREHLSTTTAWRPAEPSFRQTREFQPRRDAEFPFGHRFGREPRRLILTARASMGASTSSATRGTRVQGCMPRIRTTRRRQHRTRSPGTRVLHLHLHLLLPSTQRRTDIIAPITTMTMDATTTMTMTTRSLTLCRPGCAVMPTLSARAMVTTMLTDAATLAHTILTCRIRIRRCRHLSRQSWPLPRRP
jgi:hypothetical protein